MERKKAPKKPTAALTRTPKPEPKPEPLTHEFAGLTEDARVELAVNRIRSHHGVAVGAFLLMGQTVVDACHDGDETAALDKKADTNKVFKRIVRSLGTLKGGPSRKSLGLARRVAAATKVVRGHFWSVVPYTHKESLVRLDDTRRIAEGAKLAVESGWTVEQTDEWVDGQRAKNGVKKKRRGVRLRTARTSFGMVAEAGEPESLDRLGAEFDKLDDAERDDVRRQLDEAAQALARLRRRLR